VSLDPEEVQHLVRLFHDQVDDLLELGELPDVVRGDVGGQVGGAQSRLLQCAQLALGAIARRDIGDLAGKETRRKKRNQLLAEQFHTRPTRCATTGGPTERTAATLQKCLRDDFRIPSRLPNSQSTSNSQTTSNFRSTSELNFRPTAKIAVSVPSFGHVGKLARLCFALA